MKIVYDSHIHQWPEKSDSPEVFRSKAASVGIGGGAVFSMPPADTLFWKEQAPLSWRDRIARVLEFCEKIEHFYPFFWINPTEPTALEQVEYAKNAGIRGLKVLCSTHAPAAGMAVYRKAAELDLPIVFHSGILWDGMPSTEFNRPGMFECLLEVPLLRFALAHISWPWTDEATALFGKFLTAHQLRKEMPEMYFDSAPGAADIFREEMFRRLVLLRYGIQDHLMFAIDSSVNDYNLAWADYTYGFDRKTFAALQEKWGSWKGYVPAGNGGEKTQTINPFNETFDRATHTNFLRFLNGPREK